MRKKKKVTAPVTDIGVLVDMSIEDFKTFCGEHDMGFLKGLENYLTLTYNQMSQMRKDIHTKLFHGEISVKESVPVVEGLHVKMMRLEERVFTVREILQLRAAPTDGNSH